MQKITLTQEQFKIPPTVHMVQNDERTLKMVIADIIYEDGDVGTLYFKRSDGSYYSVQAELDESDNSYTAVVTQALTQAGITECQLKVDSSVGYISTYTFYIDVQEDVNSADDVIEQMGVSVSDLMDAVNRIMSGSLGQPTVITLASQMSDTSSIYLYLGNEDGYTSGDVYAYINGAWTDTGIYGQGEQGESGEDGQDGEDGFSPIVDVAEVAGGVQITITDKSGTTTATVENGTATDEQVSAWLTDHPEATTTIQDGAVTLYKLSEDARSAWVYSDGTDFSWEQNTIAGATGANSSSSTYQNIRIRTIGYIPSNVVALKVASGYEMTVYAYSSANVYIGCWNGSTLAKSASYITEAYLPTIGDYQYRIVIRDANDATVTTSVAEYLTYATFTDTLLSQYGKSADAKIVGDTLTDIGTRLGKVENIMPLSPSVRILNDQNLFATKTTQSSYQAGTEQIGTSGIYYKNVNNRISTYPVQASVGNFNKYHIIPKNGYQYIFRAFNTDLSAQTYTSGWMTEESDFDFSEIDASYITLTIQNSAGSAITTDSYNEIEVYSYDIIASALASQDDVVSMGTSCNLYADSVASGAGAEKLYLGTFEQGGITASGDSASTTRLRQKNIVALPCGDRRKLHVNINAGYYLGVRFGVLSTNLSENLYWYSNGDTIIVPTGCNYYRFAIANGNTSGSYTTITMDEWDSIGLSVWCENESDVWKDNAENNVIASNAMLKTGSSNNMTSYPVIVHSSDVHGDYKRLRNVLDWCDKHGKIAMACITGDLVSNNPSHGMEWVKDEIQSHDVPVALCIGNHDVLSDSFTSDSDIYNFFYNDIATDIGNATGKTWYYVDDTTANLRFISVNLYQYGATTRGYTHFTDEQLSWIVSTLLSTPANYGVIILEHSPQVDISSAMDAQHATFYQPTRLYNNNHNSVDGAPIYDIVDAFISGGTLSQTYTQTGSPSSVTVSADFTSKNTGVEFIAYLSGHYHEDTICYLPNRTNTQLVLNVAGCHTMYGASASYPYLADSADQARNPIDKSQDAFNAYIIDRTNKTIRVVRIGNDIAVGSDYSLIDRKFMIIPYV